MGAAALAIGILAADPKQSLAENPFPGAGFSIDLLDREIRVEPTPPMANKAYREKLRMALRAGGHAIVCRHGSTDWLAPDVPDGATDAQRLDRSAQRNLSSLGVAQAGAIRDALTNLGVNVAPVQATFYYRTREFAELATGTKAEVRDELLGIKYSTIEPWWSIVAPSTTLALF